MGTIRVELPGATADDRSYDIRCGSGVATDVAAAVRAAGGTRAVVIADRAVATTHAAAVVTALETAGVETVLETIPAGESSKSVAGAAALWDALARRAVDRATHVVAVGGGVTGDLAGFVAATFGRGLPLWQVPTTVVAQVDSAIGGKTGINLDAGKNLVGAFWQPRGVFADVDTLSTLPDREFVSGLAEVLKYGIILDAGFFDWLESHAADVLDRRPAALTHAIEKSAALKAFVVERDERETTGLRVVLNYGHTFGHAYETAAGYGVLLHGEAVAIGMARAARLAVRIGRLAADVVERQDALLTRLRLPVTAPALSASADDLLAIMGRDKKALGGRMRFVLPDRIGHVELVADIAPDDVRAVLETAPA